MDPSKMDKRSKEYKAWSAARAASAGEAPAEQAEPIEAVDGPVDQPLARVAEEVKAPEKKAPTKPWERKSGARPWRRDYFNLKTKRPGFRCRFVDPSNVEARLQRGYQLADPDQYGGLVDYDIRDTSGLGKVITRHGMVLMEIPEEGARAYEEHNEALIQARHRSSKAELETTAAEAGTKVTIKETVSR